MHICTYYTILVRTMSFSSLAYANEPEPAPGHVTQLSFVWETGLHMYLPRQF